MPAIFRRSILTICIAGLICWTGLNHFSLPDAAADSPHSKTKLDPFTVQLAASATPIAFASTEVRPAAKPASRVELARELARKDPWALARLGEEQYLRTIRDYTCVFLKQERINGKLRNAEEIEVRYRQDPKTVYMIWTKNADQAKRALFIDSPEFVDKNGEKLAKVEPAGAIIRLIVSEVMMPIYGKRARQSSRRSIDEFGFLSTFTLLNRYNQLGTDRGLLDLRYDGEGEIDGRPTFKIVRYLPYAGPNGEWPDAKMILHLDQEWLLPTAVYSYADREEKELLGSYVITQVKLNPGLTDADFRF